MIDKLIYLDTIFLLKIDFLAEQYTRSNDGKMEPPHHATKDGQSRGKRRDDWWNTER